MYMYVCMYMYVYVYVCMYVCILTERALYRLALRFWLVCMYVCMYVCILSMPSTMCVCVYVIYESLEKYQNLLPPTYAT